MEYYKSKDLVISPIQPEDCKALSDGFAAQGWDKPQSQYEGYLREQRAGVRQVLVARWQGEAAGYVTLRPKAKAGPFAGKGWPEIVDFNVLEKFQRKGIGSRLMDCAEAEAAKTSRIVCLGVGLHSGYGPAQRMYIKRGYLFDGTGVWYQDKHLAEGAPCANDDELVLYLSKYLPKKEVRPLCKEELGEGLFHDFCRFQPVEKAWRKAEGHWEIQDVCYTDRWGSGEPERISGIFRRLLAEGGQVWGAFLDGRLKGFCAVEGRLKGSRGQYADMAELQVSYDCRGQRLGRELFQKAAQSGRALGAEKLYISAHSAAGPMAFYRAMGCVEAEEPDPCHAAEEPCDVQMEYRL